MLVQQAWGTPWSLNFMKSGARDAHRCFFGTTVVETSLSPWAKACWTEVGTVMHLPWQSVIHFRVFLEPLLFAKPHAMLCGVLQKI